MLGRLYRHTPTSAVRARFVSANVAKYRAHGAPAQVIKMETEEVGQPKGSDVLIKMLAAPVNPSDINMIEGVYGSKATLPAVGGGEGVGVVVAAGPNVKDLKVNDWVIPAAGQFGTWRSHLLAAESSFDRVPNDIPVEYAATLRVNPATAYLLLNQFVKLKAGDVIVQNAANSVCGQAVIQLARLAGVKTLNIIRDRPNYKEVVEQLKTLGGDVVVSEEFARSSDFASVIADLPKPVLALNAVGGASSTELSRLLGNGGTMVTYGGMSKQGVIVPTSNVIFKDLSLRGFWLTRWNETHTRAERQEVLKTLADLVRAKKLKWAMERTDFAQLPSVLAATAAQKNRKTVLTF